MGAGRYAGYTEGFHSSSQFCRQFPAQFTIRPGRSLCKIFRIPVCQLIDQHSLVGGRHGKLRKEEGRIEGQKERERQTERKK